MLKLVVRNLGGQKVNYQEKVRRDVELLLRDPICWKIRNNN